MTIAEVDCWEKNDQKRAHVNVPLEDALTWKHFWLTQRKKLSRENIFLRKPLKTTSHKHIFVKVTLSNKYFLDWSFL